MLTACTPATAPFSPPSEGVLLVGLADGSQRGQLALGGDPLAVEVSGDGGTAYVSDNRGGRVLALSLPALRKLWTAEVGGRPGPLLATLDTLYVSLYDAGEVAELDPATGAVRARHPAGRQPGQLALDPGGAVLVESAEGVRDLDGRARGGGPGFALGGGWSAAYDSGVLTQVGSGFEISVGDVRVLARPRDPDQVAYLSGRIFTAAHADHEILVLDAAGKAAAQHWARGSEPVALATDPRLGLLIVVVNAAE
ncbi:MAG: hypothetical protein E6I08_15145 [Chloroflexi bacterium]|nr:MAG: hypothetical protein E6I08_15145 [Chloroflexota bacterium]